MKYFQPIKSLFNQITMTKSVSSHLWDKTPLDGVDILAYSSSSTDIRVRVCYTKSQVLLACELFNMKPDCTYGLQLRSFVHSPQGVTFKMDPFLYDLVAFDRDDVASIVFIDDDEVDATGATVGVGDGVSISIVSTSIVFIVPEDGVADIDIDINKGVEAEPVGVGVAGVGVAD